MGNVLCQTLKSQVVSLTPADTEQETLLVKVSFTQYYQNHV